LNDEQRVVRKTARLSSGGEQPSGKLYFFLELATETSGGGEKYFHPFLKIEKVLALLQLPGATNFLFIKMIISSYYYNRDGKP
jgi:hypothetical protein